MIKSCLLVLLFSICMVIAYDNICEQPTIVSFAEADTASLQLISNGDTLVFPGDSDVRATFVNQRQGAVKFHTQVGFDSGNDELCEGLVFFEINTLWAVLEDSDGYLNYYDLVSDDFFFDKKRSVPTQTVSSQFYTIAEITEEANENVFSLSGESGKYFFSGNAVIACVDESCLSTQIVNVNGQILAATESPEFLLVLSIVNGNLFISKIQSEQVIDVVSIDVQGNALPTWSFLSAGSVVGLVSQGSDVVLTIASIDGTLTPVENVGQSTLKVVKQKEFNFVTVQTATSLVNYVCKAFECRKVSTSPLANKVWDMDVSASRRSVFAFAEEDEITILTCHRFDCKEFEVATIKAPATVSNLKVSLAGPKPTIVYSLENGATAIVNCIDELCKSISLTRASDYLSSSNFAFIKSKDEFVLYANDKVQSYNNGLASPHGELCRDTIAGNHGIEDGEVFICNALPSVENYSNVYFWAPVVTSIFSQNL